MSELENAIQLIRFGRKGEAQPLLQTVIKNDPKNIPAWFWYVETCETAEKRIQTLEVCLKMNPGNPQVTQALDRFRAQIHTAPIQPEPVAKPIAPPAPAFAYYEEEPAAAQNDDLYDYDAYQASNQPVRPTYYYEEEKPSALAQNNYGYDQYRSGSEAGQSTASPKQQWELEYDSYVDKSKPSRYSKMSKSSEGVRTYSFFEVWSTALTVQDHAGYADLLNDPNATLGRAFTWIALASLVNAAILPVFMLLNPEMGDFAKMSTFIFSMAIAMPIAGVIGFAIWAGVQNLFAVLFGGQGYYTRTAYALAAFTAPITILTSLYWARA